MKTTRSKLDLYLILMRLDRPVGSLLLLWPTLAALWIAADGIPPLPMIIVFTLGTFVMRSAGCVINDYADRNVDSHVERTRNRPLALGLISKVEALLLFTGLCAVALILLRSQSDPTMTGLIRAKPRLTRLTFPARRAALHPLYNIHSRGKQPANATRGVKKRSEERVSGRFF